MQIARTLGVLLVVSVATTRPVEASCIPGFDYAAFGKDSIGVGGNSSTNSYNSAVGKYSLTMTASGGNIATNGTACSSASLNGASTAIRGTMQYGTGGTGCSASQGSATVTGSIGPLPAPVTLTSVTIPTTATLPLASPASPSSGNITLAPNKTYTDFTLNPSHTLTLTSGWYVFDDLTLKGTVVVSPGPVIIFITGSLDMNGTPNINAIDPQKSTNLLFMAGPTATSISVKGGTNSSFAVYAPDTNVSVNGGSDIYGAIVGKSVSASGGVGIHYDLALGSFAGGGFLCPTDEISRAQPIATTVGSTAALVQGTYERFEGASTPLTMTSSADADAFRFPHLKGHVRAVSLTQYATTAKTFSQLTSLFDAANGIPSATNSYSGSCTQFSASCRTVFTNIVGGFNPARVLFRSTNLGTIGPLMASTLTATERGKLMQRVLAGIEVSTGVFVAKLGGVDRSTVAVIPTSTVSGTARPTMIYVGATDGMLHAVCASIQGACTSLGQELWAFMPRNQLASVRFNTTRIDGSPRVTDMFGDFTGSGTRRFRTILSFHTASGDPTTAGSTPAVYALDVTDPTDPKIVWEYTLANPSARAAVEMGQGTIMAHGRVMIGGKIKVAAFAHTNNGGTGGAGSVVTAIDVETGGALWSTGMHSSRIYASPPRGSGTAVPTTGLPGGVVAVDLKGEGWATDLVLGTLYGDVWQLDAATGISRHGANPLFRFSSNGHPVGATPSIYGNGGSMFAVAVAGAYDDLTAASLWSTSPHKSVAVSLSTPASAAPLSESSGAPYVPFVVSMGANEKASSQAQVIGGEIYFATDTTDINALTYGTGTTDTGRIYKVSVGTYMSTSVVVRGGASSVSHVGTALYAASSNRAVQLSNVSSATGVDVTRSSGAKVSRSMWLRSL